MQTPCIACRVEIPQGGQAWKVAYANQVLTDRSENITLEPRGLQAGNTSVFAQTEEDARPGKGARMDV